MKNVVIFILSILLLIQYSRPAEGRFVKRGNEYQQRLKQLDEFYKTISIEQMEFSEKNLISYLKRCGLTHNSDKVRTTVYHAVEEECNSDPGHTAFMFELNLKNPYKHKIIAVSRNLLKKYPNGSKVYVVGTGKYDGIYTVRDKMNKRFKNCIDILINKDMPIGCWNNVRIYKLNKAQVRPNLTSNTKWIVNINKVIYNEIDKSESYRNKTTV